MQEEIWALHRLNLTPTSKPLSELSEIFPGAEKRVSNSFNNEGHLAS